MTKFTTLVTMASICLVSGLLVLSGGEPNHGNNANNGTVSKHDREYAKQ